MAELPIATQCGTGAPAAPPLDSRPVSGYGACFYESAAFSRWIVGMTRVGIYSRTNDTHETGPPKSEQLPTDAA